MPVSFRSDSCRRRGDQDGGVLRSRNFDCCDMFQQNLLLFPSPHTRISACTIDLACSADRIDVPKCPVIGAVPALYKALTDLEIIEILTKDRNRSLHRSSDPLHFRGRHIPAAIGSFASLQEQMERVNV